MSYKESPEKISFDLCYYIVAVAKLIKFSYIANKNGKIFV